jgi:hypothetical protein
MLRRAESPAATRAQIDAFVEHYDHRRYRESLSS